MELQEAIEHCREVADKLECSACGSEHTQLAQWLEDLQEAKRILDNVYYWETCPADYRETIAKICNIAEVDDE